MSRVLRRRVLVLLREGMTAEEISAGLGVPMSVAEGVLRGELRRVWSPGCGHRRFYRDFWWSRGNR